jgi:urease alpha subunit
VNSIRGVRKQHMVLAYLPRMEIDQTYAVRDGQLLTCEPATTCPWRSATSCFEVPCYPHR